MTFPLSVLDVSPVISGSSSAEALRNTVELARFVDQLGYTRFWLAEHHNSPGIASTSPEIMTGVVARETKNIRVGSGGVMLPNHSPLKVAESFKLLEALYPERIDLGIGRAPGTDGMTALALRRSQEALNADDFPEQLAELFAFSSGRFPAGHPFRTVAAYPDDVNLPPIWLLGSSGYSSQLASAVGTGFAFAHHINPGPAVQAMTLYREQFKPSDQFPQPHAIIAASVICADTDAEAEDMASALSLAFLRLQTGRASQFPTLEEVRSYPFTEMERTQFQAIRARYIVGSPAAVREDLDRLIEQTKADELMMLTIVPTQTARLRSYELLAELFELRGQSETDRAGQINS